MKLNSVQIASIVVLFSSNTMLFASEIECPKTITNSSECSQYVEKTLSKRYPMLFKRINNKLIISLSNGNKKVYINTNQEEGSGSAYSLVQYYPEIGYGLVDRQEYEGGWKLLVNLRTGKDVGIARAPTISPDKKRIAVTNVDLESEYTENELAIYRLESNSAVLEYKINPTNWGAGNERWISNTEIFFTKFTSNNTNNLHKEFKKLKYMNAINSNKGSWHIE